MRPIPLLLVRCPKLISAILRSCARRNTERPYLISFIWSCGRTEMFTSQACKRVLDGFAKPDQLRRYTSTNRRGRAAGGLKKTKQGSDCRMEATVPSCQRLCFYCFCSAGPQNTTGRKKYSSVYSIRQQRAAVGASQTSIAHTAAEIRRAGLPSGPPSLRDKPPPLLRTTY
jgi:hypothetical protein